MKTKTIRMIAAQYRRFDQGRSWYTLPAHDPNDPPIYITLGFELSDDSIDIQMDTGSDHTVMTVEEARGLAAVLLDAIEDAETAVIVKATTDTTTDLVGVLEITSKLKCAEVPA